jgi:poly(ADP-ribose) glycohydrolase ARH3
MIKSGLNWRDVGEKIYPGGSYGNGSAMRIAPIGLFCYDNPDRLREIACGSSRITHTHVLGMKGAALQAYAVALAVTTEPGQLEEDDFLERLGSFVEADLYREKVESMKVLLREAAGKLEVIRELGNTVEAFNSVPISIYSFLANSGFRNCLEYALSLGGDRDTISAMTGAIAGACYGLEEIPAEWRSGLENRDYIEKLGEDLWRIKVEGRTAE